MRATFTFWWGVEWRRGREPGRRFGSRAEDAPSDVHQIDDHSRVPSLSGLPAVLPERPVRVFFPCTGLGRQRRGFETFTLECAGALRHDPTLEIRVFAGGPVSELPVHVLANLPRDSRAARWLAAFHRRDSYFSEQLTFFLSFLPHLIRGAPDVVYFADLNLGNLCWHWRRLSGQRYRLLYYNGGLTTKPFTRADAVQQLTPAGLAEAQERGEDTSRQVVLPHGVNVPEDVPTRIIGDARRTLGLPADRMVVLSAGLLDVAIKRMDVLIREIARLPAPRPFLVLLDEMDAYYRAADAFALASLREGFGLAYVEALAHGLPVIAHDFPVTRYLLDGFGALADLRVEGELARLVSVTLQKPITEDERRQRHASAKARFGWPALMNEYSTMLHWAASLPLRAAT